jgi:hypothetical protein
MKYFIIALSLSLYTVNHLQAQYYYKDFVSNNQAIKEMELYKKAGIKSVKIKSLEANGEESQDFFCEKKISKDYKKTSLYTRSGNTGKSLMETYFDAQGLLIKTYDSSDIVVSVNQFFYDKNNKLIKTNFASRSNDDDFVNEITEEHIYQFNEDGLPGSMIKIKNKTDSLLILFSKDENNNIAIEKDTKTGAKYYYYYDESNRFTDLVHSNEFKQKMVADYIFEYNNEGLVSQMTTTEEGNDNFIVWKYDYVNGLKVKERIFDKNGELMGKILYEYK